MSDPLHEEESDALSLSEHARKNRVMWEATSDSYEQRHAASLEGKQAMAWGLWRIPEEELHILGEVAGKDVLVGAIDVATGHVETPEEVAATIGQALKYVPAERLFPCTNCGMAPLDQELAYKKLEALAAGATLVRGRH